MNIIFIVFSMVSSDESEMGQDKGCGRGLSYLKRGDVVWNLDRILLGAMAPILNSIFTSSSLPPL